MTNNSGGLFEVKWREGGNAPSRKMIVAAILGVALVAFEIFNFDTTQFALSNLMGEVRFAGVMWATILAIAFCAIDFAGLVRIFTPQRGAEEPKAVWYLTGAWFLGTIANSVLTWWAVSLTLLSHDFGNEVLSREALLRYVPIFVAMLVWLTRILFIGAFSVAGENAVEQVRNADSDRVPAPPKKAGAALPARNAQPAAQPPVAAAKPAPARPAAQPRPATAAPVRPAVTYEPVDDPFEDVPVMPKTNGSGGPSRPTSRIQQRPPMPGGANRPMASGNVRAGSSNQRN
jgi:hypothetical protein